MPRVRSSIRLVRVALQIGAAAVVIGLAGPPARGDGCRDYSRALVWEETQWLDSTPIVLAAPSDGERLVVLTHSDPDGHQLRVFGHDDETDPLEALGSLSLSGWPRDAIFVGHLVYVAAGSAGLHVVDVSDAAAPVLVTTVEGGGSFERVRCRDGLALVAAGVAGCHVLDCADPRAPVLVWTLSTPDWSGGLDIRNDLAALTMGARGVRLVDLASPYLDTVVDLPVPGYCLDVAFDESMRVAVAEADEGVLVYDVSDLRHARLLRTVRARELITRVRATGGRILATDYRQGVAIIDCVDVTNPPYWIPTLRDVRDAIGVGDRLFVADGLAGVTRYSAWREPVDQPTTIVSDARDVRDVRTEGRFAYVAERLDGLGIYDVHTDHGATEVARVLGRGIVDGVEVSQGIAITLEDAGATVVDVTDPRRPVVTGFVPLEEATRGVAIVSGFAYLAVGWDKLAIVRLDDEPGPSVIDTIDTLGLVADVIVDGDRMYVIDRYYGVHVYDVTDPRHPEFLDQWTSVGTFLSTGTVADGLLYVVYRSPFGWPVGGLHVVDVRSPGAFVELSRLSVPGAPLDLDVDERGRHLYVADAWTGVDVFSIDDPERLMHVGALPAPGLARSVRVHGDDVYVGAGSGGAVVFDVQCRSDETPILIGAVSAVVVPRGVVVSWESGSDGVGVDVFRRRDRPGSSLVKLTGEPIRGAGRRSFLDTEVAPGTYVYQLRSSGPGGIEWLEPLDVRVGTPSGVSPPSPNPFAAETVLHLEWPSDGTVTAVVYDVRGRRVATLADRARVSAGSDVIGWDGRDARRHLVAAGVYTIVIRARLDGASSSPDAADPIVERHRVLFAP